MSKSESNYSKKTKIREVIFSAYLAGDLDMDSVISRLAIYSRQFGYFLSDGVEYCLMHLVDDATKTSLACLYKAECTLSALDVLYKWCCKYRVPQSIYSDRHSTYKVNENHKLTIEDELNGREIEI